jgi:hypothetical protein
MPAFPKPLVEEWSPLHKRTTMTSLLFVRISAVRESLLLVFRNNRQLFLELLAFIGINDIVVRKKWGVWGGIWRWWSRRRW